MYFDEETSAWGLTESQIIAAHPQTIFPTPFVPLERYRAIVQTLPPSHDPAVEKVIEVMPVEVDGVRVQQWQIVPLTQSEIDALRPSVPVQVPRYCGLLALKRHRLIEGALQQLEAEDDWADGSLLACVHAYRAGLPAGEVRDKLDVALNDVLHWTLLSPTVAQLCAVLGLTAAQRDALFVWAKQQEAAL